MQARIQHNPTKYSTGCVSENLDRFGGLSQAISLFSCFWFVFVDVGILVICITELFFSLDMQFGKTSSPDSWHRYTRCRTKKLYNTGSMFLHISVSGGKDLTAITQLPVHRHLNTMTTQQAWHPVYSTRSHIWGKPRGTWRVIIQ